MTMAEVAKMEDQRQEVQLRDDPMISMIERVVLNPDADLDKLERMLAMKERMDAQSAKVSFARALSAARMSIPPIIKDAKVDYTSQKGRTHYKHETLAGIAKAIDPILAEHGLSYRFRTDQGNGGVKVTCVIQHADGHSEETSLAGAPDGSGSKNSFQAVGSAVTYLQRYTLKAALGLSAEVDDDGQSAGPRGDDVPRFNAEAAAGRIVMKIRNAKTLDALSGIWRDEADTIMEIKAASRSEFSRIEDEKNRTKAEMNSRANADLSGDEIPY